MYIQFLNCSTNLGTCCSDYALANFLDLSRRIIELLQLIAPILLLVMASIQLIRLVVNPELKNGLKGLTNKFIAAAVIFFVPIIVNAAIGMLPVEYSLNACWQTAKTMRELSKATPQRYAALSNKKPSSIIPKPEDYESGDPSSDGGGSGSSNTSGTGGGKIVNVALGEIGNHESDHSHHKYEAFTGMSDDQAWCAAFVTWCAGQAGYLDKGIFPKFVGCNLGFRQFRSLNADIHLASSGYTPKAGDIVFFSWTGSSDLDHVGIVVSADSKNVYTVEGNTSCEGEAASRCGGSDGVSRKTRRRNNLIYAYVTPHYGS